MEIAERNETALLRMSLLSIMVKRDPNNGKIKPIDVDAIYDTLHEELVKTLLGKDEWSNPNTVKQLRAMSHMGLIRNIERKVIEKVNKLNAFAAQSKENEQRIKLSESTCLSKRKEKWLEE